MSSVNNSENEIRDNYWNNKLKKAREMDIKDPNEYLDPYTLRYTSKVINEVRNRLGVITGKSFLELGCGTGKNGIIMQSKHRTITTLLDSSTSALQYAKFLAEERNENIKLVQADMFNIPFKEDSFDITFNGGTIEHYSTQDAKSLVNEMQRVTKKGGYVIVYVPNLINPQIFLYHLKIKLGLEKNIIGIPNEKYYNHASLKKLFIECGFSIGDIYLTSIDHVFPHFMGVNFMETHNNIEKRLRKQLGFFHIVIAKKT